MKTKRLFSGLLQIGFRLTVLASMLMMAFAGNVGSAAAATPLTLNGVSVGAQTGTLTFGGTGSVTYSVTVTRSGTSPVVFLPSVSGLPAGVSGAFSGNFFFAGSSRVITLTLTKSGAAAPNAGNYNFTVTASSFNGTANGAGTLAIGKASQTITFGSLADKTMGDSDFNVSATASSGLTVNFAAAGNCTVAGTLVHLTSAGSCTITASQAGGTNYLAATDVPQTFSIAPSSGGGGGGSASFDLYAVTGSTNLPGLSSPVMVWGYNTADAPVSQPGGPTLEVNQGDLVTITLHNQLSEQTALLLQGQSIAPDLVGAPAGGTQTYTFRANKPGTFLYEAGLLPNAQHQVAMGLYGALVVHSSTASQAYDSAATAFDAEQVLVLSELDTALNNSADPSTFDMRLYSPKYYLINGKTYPDTASISVTAGDTVLLRYVNAGMQAHAMSTLGLSQTIIAQDGSPYDFSHTVTSETIATGQTLDTLVTIPAAGTQFPLYDASLYLRNNTGNGTFAGLGGMMTVLTTGTVTTSDTTGPVTSAMSMTPNPSDGTLDVAINATVSDASAGNSNVTAAEFYVDNTSGSPIAITGTFGSPTASVTGTIPTSLLGILAAGDHMIYVRGQDSAGNWGSFQSVILTLQTSSAPVTSLYFSNTGTTSSGPNGVGADAADIYLYDGSAFSQAIDAPAGTNVDGFDRVDDTHYYMSFAGTVTLPGAGTVQDEDVVYNDNGTWSVYFDGTAQGLGASNLDAISVVGGTLYFSTSDTTLPSGVGGVGDDADIYSWDGSAFARVFDATAQGWSSNNVDGFTYIDATHFYLSYSSTGTSVAGLGTVQDEDVVYFNDGNWSVYFDGTVNGLTTTSLDVDAFDLP
ncbi:MAG: multicopper oxidase domain-containing protein [Anaerolineales bacterium]